MKTFLLAASALALTGGALAANAGTSASGTVTVNGSVAAKCNITSPSTATIEVNELAQANGTVVPNFDNAGGKSVSFSVQCTSPNPGLSLNATALNFAGGTTVAGYTHTVHYTSTLTAVPVTGPNATVTYTTADALPGPSTGSVGAPLANAANNITIAISNSRTTSATSLLEASPTDGYTGTITFTISPS